MKRKYFVGQRFTAIIDGKSVEGKIQIEDGNIFLCQDKSDGFSPNNNDTLGYKCSWRVNDGSDRELIANQVRDLVLSNNANEYKDWQVGDKVKIGDYFAKVIFRSGELVVLKNLEDGMATANFTCDELYEDGARLQTTEICVEETSKVVELTLAQIANKFDIPIESLRVKD